MQCFKLFINTRTLELDFQKKDILMVCSDEIKMTVQVRRQALPQGSVSDC